MLLQFSFSPIRIVFAFTILYYGVLTLSNITSIYLLAQARHGSSRDNMLFDYSEKSLRFLTSAIGGMTITIINQFY